MIDKPIEQFLDELASKAPAPGGGSVAAVVGAMGAALLSMVCNLTLGKKGYESVEGEMARALKDTERLRTRLAALVEADINAFNQVMAAYRLPKDSEALAKERAVTIQKALKIATEVPLECARLCAEVVNLSRRLAEQGNRNVVSDAGAAVMVAHAGLKCSVLNVHVNAGNIRDEHYLQPRLNELQSLLERCEVEAGAVFELVKAQL